MSICLSSSAASISSLLEPNESGIHIVVSDYLRPGGIKSIRVMGVCQASYEEFADVQKSMIHAVTIIFTHEPYHNPVSFSAAGDSIVFDDDIQVIGKLNRAYFDIDIFDQVDLQPEAGTYYVSASFGKYLSSVVKLSL